MRYTILLASLLGMAGLPTCLEAQIKLPVFDGSKDRLDNVTFQDAGAGTYRHGNVVRITTNTDSSAPIKGVVVRTDPSKGRIYVRTQPGMSPRAVPISDVKRIEMGVIKEASFTTNVAIPEIHEMVIYNGSKQTVTYNAPTLSPGEVAQLRAIQTAANELSRVNYVASQEEIAREKELAIQVDQQRTRDLINYLAAVRLTPGLPFLPDYRLTSGLPFVPDYRAPDGVLTPLGVSNGLGLWLQPRPEIIVNAPLPVASLSPTSVSVPNVPVSPDAVARAKRTYLAVQAHAVYENGHLVAVIPDDADNAPTTDKR